MSHKVAITAASAAAALTLAVALAAAGFAPGAPATSASSATTAEQVVSDPASTPQVVANPAPTVQVDTIYLAPVPKPRTITIHKVVKTSGGEDTSEQESEQGSENDG